MKSLVVFESIHQFPNSLHHHGLVADISRKDVATFHARICAQVQCQWIENEYITRLQHVVLRVSDKKVSAAHLQRDFVHSFKMGGQSSLVVLPVSSIVGPLATFTNYGGADNEHYAILPHRKWGKYFSDRIVVPDNSS